MTAADDRLIDWLSSGRSHTPENMPPDYVPQRVLDALHTLEWPKEETRIRTWGSEAVQSGLPAHQQTGTLDWCQGCDGIWKRWSMGWTELGLYRCVECRRTDGKHAAPQLL